MADSGQNDVDLVYSIEYFLYFSLAIFPISVFIGSTSKRTMSFLEHLLVNSLGGAEADVSEASPLGRPGQDWAKRFFSAVVTVVDDCMVPDLFWQDLQDQVDCSSPEAKR